ncbi:hypothetical protein FQR65_LT04201 [Abscondita terminalis]|nr:hypothetical protein FQR65_LT04201 [Abscondita terminalis]
MSNIIPPLLSNSPPPMVGAVIDEEDDEFGNFAVVNNLSYDDDVLSLTSEDINIKEIPESPHLHSLDKDYQDRRKDNGVDISDECDDDNKINCNRFQYFAEIPPDISINDSTLKENDTESEIKEIEVINNLNSTEECGSLCEDNEEEVQQLSDVIECELQPSPDFDDDFADFDAFTNTPSTNSDVVKPINEIMLEQPFGFVQHDIENEVDDDFGDFNNYSLTSQISQIDIEEVVSEKPENVIMLMFPNIDEHVEDFHDENFIFNDIIFSQLKDITDTLALSYQWSKSNSQHFLLQALNIDTRNILYGPRWNESMPRYAATLGFTPLEPVKSETHASNGETISSHVELVEQTEIPLAEFDWVGSGLTNPLEITPKKILEKQQTTTVDQINERKLDSSTSQLHANSDTDSIKSLKLVTNSENDKVDDDDFDDFSSFQSINNGSNNFNSFELSKNEHDNWPPLRETQIANVNQTSKNGNEHFESWTSLRETHISNAKIDEPSWLKPTILTPDLSRKENATTSQFEEDEEEDEEFTDFQTGNIEQTSIEEVKEIKVKEPQIPSSDSFADDSFSQFQCTPVPVVTKSFPEPMQPLQPSILQPVKVENAPTTINWPNPGVTDEELHRFDMFFKPGEASTKDDRKLINDPIDEDDWSDFISNQSAQNSAKKLNSETPRCQPLGVESVKKEHFLVKPPLPFSQNGFATSLVSNEYVVLNRMHTKTDDVEDEWSDFISSQPPTESPSRVPKSSIPKLNLDWNGPPQFTSWSASITPNIITNPVSFESFQSFAPLDADLLRNRSVNKKNPSVVIQPKKNTVPSIATVPDLDFIAPKNRTWKK